MGALKELFILGEIRTTVEYLGELLETDAFKVSARASSVRVSVRLVPGRADRDGCLQGGAASALTVALTLTLILTMRTPSTLTLSLTTNPSPNPNP